jgi:dipeptidase
MKKILLAMLFASATFAHAGWYYWDHGRLMWTNKYGYVEDVDQVEQEERDQELQDKLDEINDKLDEIKKAQEDLEGTTVAQQPHHSKGLGYRFVPARNDHWNNVCTP